MNSNIEPNEYLIFLRTQHFTPLYITYCKYKIDRTKGTELFCIPSKRYSISKHQKIKPYKPIII